MAAGHGSSGYGGVDFRAYALQKARQYGISNPQWFVNQIGAESNFNPGAVSPAGAIGIAQIMPATARGWGVDPHDPLAALDAAARNMAQYERKYGGYRNALVAYNAGPGRVGKPLFAETAAYIKKIMGGADVPAGGAVAPYQPQSAGFGAPAGGVQFDPETVRRIAEWDKKSREGVMNGQTVDMAPDLVAKIKAARAAAGAAPAGQPIAASPGGFTASGGLVSPLSVAMSAGSEYNRPDGPEGAPDGRGGSIHAGKDWFAPAGAQVVSPVTGRVVEVKMSRGNSGQVFGGVVKVQGPDGRVYVFRHVDPSSVQSGAEVRAGAPIARVSAWTGGSPHAHVEVWKTLGGGYTAGNMLDPVQVFGGR